MSFLKNTGIWWHSSTLGDVMLIEGENRALVRAGLKVLNQNTTPGLRDKKTDWLEGRQLDSLTTVFSLVPA